LEEEQQQKEMIINVGNWHSGIRNAVVQFFKEYNGEEIKFEEEW
jgi:hypothetical protein